MLGLERLNLTRAKASHFTLNSQWLIWALLWLAAALVWFRIVQTQPQTQFTFLPDQRIVDLGQGGTANGFHQAQVDAAGNRYVWTYEHSTLVFDFQVRKPIALYFELRSAATPGTGGPDAPVRVLVDGVEVAQFRPDPTRLDFQRFELKINSPPSAVAGQLLTVDLYAQPYKPPRDSRTLGVQLRSITLDKSEAWSGVQKRLWLLWLWPGLLLGAAILAWLSYQLKPQSPPRSTSFRPFLHPAALAGYGAVALSAASTVALLALVVLLWRIGRFDNQNYAFWLAGLTYGAVLGWVSTFRLPFGSWGSPSLYSRVYGWLPLTTRQQLGPRCQRLARTWAGATRQVLTTELNPVWVSGLALLLIYIGSLLLKPGTESYEWTLYLLLGVPFPALTLFLALLAPTRLGRASTKLLAVLKPGLALFLLFLVGLFLVKHGTYYALPLATVQVVLAMLLAGRWPTRHKPANLTGLWAWAAANFFIAAVGWTLVGKLLWWRDSVRWVLGSFYTELVFGLAWLLVLVALYYRGGWPWEWASLKSRLYRPGRATLLARPLPKIAWGWLGHSGAALVFGWLSIRTQQLFVAETSSHLHWSFYVGPAELVRQGGALLWDVPSQYGFLSILLIAVLPLGSVWQTFFTANAVLLFLSACFMYWILRLVRPGWLGFVFALTLTVATIFLIPGWLPEQTGPMLYPSVGAYRFGWCYALLAILIWEWRSQKTKATPNRKIWLIGSLVWLFGCLWSAESAIYCTAVWLPAYALMVWRGVRGNAEVRMQNAEYGMQNVEELSSLIPHPSSVTPQSPVLRPQSSSFLPLFLWLAVPFGMLAGAVGGISLLYGVRLGHGPDWQAFFEYASSYQSDFGTELIDPNGSVWVLFLVFCGISTVAFYFLRRGLSSPALSLIAGSWALLWTTASYFVGRSVENNISNLTALYCTSLIITLLVIGRGLEGDRSPNRPGKAKSVNGASNEPDQSFRNGWADLVKTSFVPVLTIVLVLAYSNSTSLGRALFSEPKDFNQLEKLLPMMDTSMLKLLNSAQARPTDPLIFVNTEGAITLAPAWPSGTADDYAYTTNAWLSAYPYSILIPIRPERGKLYLDRFAARTHASGWLLQSKSKKIDLPWLPDYLALHYTPTRFFETSDWKLTWYEYKG